MKMVPAKVVEVDQEGFLALMGQQVEIMCNVYIYTGKLVGVNDTCIKLEDAALVFETGAFTDLKYKDAQRFPEKVRYIQVHLIESFGPTKKTY